MSNSAIAILIAAAVVAIIVIVVALLAMRRRRAQRLHDRFGPEYDRVVGSADGRRDRRSAQEDLAERVERHDQLQLRPLDPGARDRYLERWHDTQAAFVDTPGPALAQAEALLDQVMAERGYPVDDFEEQAALISVDHPQLVDNYRSAHALRDQVGRPGTDTESMRDAMLRYRSLFDELLAPEDSHAA
jgi:hypothetical protein